MHTYTYTIVPLSNKRAPDFGHQLLPVSLSEWDWIFHKHSMFFTIYLLHIYDWSPGTFQVPIEVVPEFDSPGLGQKLTKKQSHRCRPISKPDLQIVFLLFRSHRALLQGNGCTFLKLHISFHSFLLSAFHPSLCPPWTNELYHRWHMTALFKWEIFQEWSKGVFFYNMSIVYKADIFPNR